LAAQEPGKARCRAQLEQFSPVLPRERDQSRIVLFSHRRIIPARQQQIAAQPTDFILDLLNLRCVVNVSVRTNDLVSWLACGYEP
jgi:hypothetical protein